MIPTSHKHKQSLKQSLLILPPRSLPVENEQMKVKMNGALTCCASIMSIAMLRRLVFKRDPALISVFTQFSFRCYPDTLTSPNRDETKFSNIPGEIIFQVKSSDHDAAAAAAAQQGAAFTNNSSKTAFNELVQKTFKASPRYVTTTFMSSPPSPPPAAAGTAAAGSNHNNNKQVNVCKVEIFAPSDCTSETDGSSTSPPLLLATAEGSTKKIAEEKAIQIATPLILHQKLLRENAEEERNASGTASLHEWKHALITKLNTPYGTSSTEHTRRMKLRC
jgi:hypothetical protein